MQIQTIKTAEDIVREETGALLLRIVALRHELELQKQEIATLKMEIATAAKVATP